MVLGNKAKCKSMQLYAGVKCANFELVYADYSNEMKHTFLPVAPFSPFSPFSPIMPCGPY